MSGSLASRLQRLEAIHDKPLRTVVWCDDASDMETTISQMHRAGETSATALTAFVHWQAAEKGDVQPGAHERALDELQGSSEPLR